MKTKPIPGRATAVLTLLLTSLMILSVSAQTMMEMNTAMNISDTLSGASVGPPPNVMGAAGMAAPGAPPAYGAPYDPMAPYGATAMMAPPGVTPPVEAEKQILVLTGQRVLDAVTKALLEDVHFEKVPEDRKNVAFYDDGTHGDLVPNDNIWTNILEERRDVLSPESNYIKLIYLRMLEISEETNPIEFFRIPIATDEPLSSLPKVSEKEADRDETFLRTWNKQFLALYRQDGENPESDFLPIFVANAPQKPETPAPPADQFNPNAYALDRHILRVVDQAIQPAVAPPPPPPGYVGTGRNYGGSSTGRGGAAAYSGDRWQNLRRDATAIRFGSYQSSSYFGR